MMESKPASSRPSLLPALGVFYGSAHLSSVQSTDGPPSPTLLCWAPFWSRPILVRPAETLILPSSQGREAAPRPSCGDQHAVQCPAPGHHLHPYPARLRQRGPVCLAAGGHHLRLPGKPGVSHLTLPSVSMPYLTLYLMGDVKCAVPILPFPRGGVLCPPDHTLHGGGLTAPPTSVPHERFPVPT